VLCTSDTVALRAIDLAPHTTRLYCTMFRATISGTSTGPRALACQRGQVPKQQTAPSHTTVHYCTAENGCHSVGWRVPLSSESIHCNTRPPIQNSEGYGYLLLKAALALRTSCHKVQTLNFC